jgi:hypothetical protein
LNRRRVRLVRAHRPSPRVRLARRARPTRRLAPCPPRRVAPPILPRFARARSTRHRDARCRAAVVRRTGEDEPTQTPGVVRRAFAVDLGGPTPAAVALAFPDATDAVCFELTRPLGVVFEQRLSGATTEIFVDEVVENGAAAKAGVERGDVLRLCTAVFEVSAPEDVTTWLNPPAKRKVKAYYECDAKPFDKVMDALASHGVQIDTPNGKEDVKFVGLVLQRARA